MLGHFIKSVETVNIAGGFKVDIVTLSNGKILTINEECVVCRNDIDSLYEDDATKIDENLPIIDFY